MAGSRVQSCLTLRRGAFTSLFSRWVHGCFVFASVVDHSFRQRVVREHRPSVDQYCGFAFEVGLRPGCICPRLGVFSPVQRVVREYRPFVEPYGDFRLGCQKLTRAFLEFGCTVLAYAVTGHSLVYGWVGSSDRSHSHLHILRHSLGYFWSDVAICTCFGPAYNDVDGRLYLASHRAAQEDGPSERCRVTEELNPQALRSIVAAPRAGFNCAVYHDIGQVRDHFVGNCMRKQR